MVVCIWEGMSEFRVWMVCSAEDWDGVSVALWRMTVRVVFILARVVVVVPVMVVGLCSIDRGLRVVFAH